MDDTWKHILWRQFGASIDMLENAIAACPDEIWRDPEPFHQYWYMAYHTLFFLDLYLSGTLEDFHPPDPFTLDEIDPAGVMPPRVYTKDELLRYLAHGRAKCRETMAALTDARAREHCRFPWGEMSFGELLVYSMRHVQHHTAQMNMLLRQRIDSAPRWVGKTQQGLES
jgi:uncharacterized damage-inducible protein DinB